MIHDEYVFGQNSVAQCMDGYLIVGTVGVTHLSVRLVRVMVLGRCACVDRSFQRCRVVDIRVY